jgi:hypothetical protein
VALNCSRFETRRRGGRKEIRRGLSNSKTILEAKEKKYILRFCIVVVVVVVVSQLFLGEGKKYDNLVPKFIQKGVRKEGPCKIKKIWNRLVDCTCTGVAAWWCGGGVCEQYK